MNDLTKEARAREYAAAMNRRQQMNNEALQNRDALANAMAGPKYGDKSLNPDRPLTGKPEHYLTRYEGSPCRRINFPSSSNQEAEIDAYMDGHSEGMAAGMTLMDQNMEESRTGINPNKINRVSDEYRRISDEVETDS